MPKGTATDGKGYSTKALNGYGENRSTLKTFIKRKANSTVQGKGKYRELVAQEFDRAAEKVQQPLWKTEDTNGLGRRRRKGYNWT